MELVEAMALIIKKARQARSRKILVAIVFSSFVLLTLGGCSQAASGTVAREVAPAASATAVPLPSATAEPSATPTVRPTASPTPPPTETSTPLPSPTATSTPSALAAATPRASGLRVVLDPPQVAQGRSVVVHVGGSDLSQVTGTLAGRALTFVRDAEGFWAVGGFGALTKVGQYALAITARTAAGQALRDNLQVTVVAGGYETENIDLPPSSTKLLDNTLIAQENQKVMAKFTTLTAEKLWTGVFARPLDTEITSDFGTRRSYNGGPATSYHEGTDFDGDVGTQIHAPAAGRVVLAEKLNVRGNAVIIDHGLGVYSGLYHMSELDVQVGQMVQPGDVVGKVGATGLVTGAHLHWDLRINGLNVDPLEWTKRAIP